MKAMTFICCLLAMVGAIACGQDETRAADLRELDRLIPTLPLGTSPEDAESQLGASIDRSELEDGEVSLLYPSWQLVFDPALIARLRYYKAGHWPRTRPFGPLDRKVRRLQLGLSRGAVESRLGKPGTWEIRVPDKKEFLWYGNGRWSLKFVDHRLVAKDYTEQVTRPRRAFQGVFPSRAALEISHLT